MCVILLFVMAAIAAVAGWLAVIFLSAWAAEAGWAVVSVTLFAAPLLALLVHEAGHLLSGVAAGMRPVLMIAGPFGLHWRHGQRLPRLRSGPLLLGGFTLCLPRTCENVPTRMARMTAGGPLASLVLATVAAAVALSTEGNASHAAGVTGAVSALLFLVTAVPYDRRGMTSDGAKILSLRKGGPNVRSLAASQCLLADAHEGVPPAQWPEDLIATALEAEKGAPERASALHLAYWSALDAGAIGKAASMLTELRAETRHASETIAGPAAYEAALYHLFVRREPAAARALIGDRRPVFLQERYVDPLIRAGLALAGGKRKLAAKEAHTARAALGKALLPAVAGLHGRWLDRLEAELETLAGPAGGIT